MPTWRKDVVNQDLEHLRVRMDSVDEARITCRTSFNLEGVDPSEYHGTVAPTLEEMEPGEYVNVAIYREDAHALFDLLEDREELGFYFLDHCGCGGDLFRIVKRT